MNSPFFFEFEKIVPDEIIENRFLISVTRRRSSAYKRDGLKQGEVSQVTERFAEPQLKN